VIRSASRSRSAPTAWPSGRPVSRRALRCCRVASFHSSPSPARASSPPSGSSPPGSAASAIAAATMLGTRNALYGIQMAPLLNVRAHAGCSRPTSRSMSRRASRSPGPTGRRGDARGFWITGLGSSSSGTSSRWSVRSAPALGNPATWDSTRRSRRRFWVCCGRACRRISCAPSRSPPWPSRCSSRRG